MELLYCGSCLSERLGGRRLMRLCGSERMGGVVVLSLLFVTGLGNRMNEVDDGY